MGLPAAFGAETETRTCGAILPWGNKATPTESQLWLEFPAALTKEIAWPHIPKISRSLTRENLHITTIRLSTTTQVSLKAPYGFIGLSDTNSINLQRNRQNEYVDTSPLRSPLYLRCRDP